MNLDDTLEERAGSKCELCGGTNELLSYAVPPDPDGSAQHAVLTCKTCSDQLLSIEKLDPIHWRCLNDSMWNTEPAVQVVVWRMLNKLKAESWPVDLLDMMYMEEETLKWAKIGLITEDEPAVIHKDVNGNVLVAGDSVVLIKDLKVKGASFIAKQGTAVRRISLVEDNVEHIEGKVEGQRIVILTKYVKKQK